MTTADKLRGGMKIPVTVGSLRRRTQLSVFALAPQHSSTTSALTRTYVYCLNWRCSQWLIPIIQPKNLARQSL